MWSLRQGCRKLGHTFFGAGNSQCEQITGKRGMFADRLFIKVVEHRTQLENKARRNYLFWKFFQTSLTLVRSKLWGRHWRLDFLQVFSDNDDTFFERVIHYSVDTKAETNVTLKMQLRSLCRSVGPTFWPGLMPSCSGLTLSNVTVCLCLQLNPKVLAAITLPGELWVRLKFYNSAMCSTLIPHNLQSNKSLIFCQRVMLTDSSTDSLLIVLMLALYKEWSQEIKISSYSFQIFKF